MELYAAVAAHSPDMMALLDAQYRHIDVSAAYHRAFGLSKEQVLELSLPELLDQEVFERFLKPLVDQSLSGSRSTHEGWFDLPGQNSRYLTVNCAPHSPAAPGPPCCLLIARDTTKHKQTELRLLEAEQERRAWLEHSPACTKILDLDFNLKYMSTAGVEALDIDDVGKLYGHPYPFDFYPESFKELMTSNLRKAVQTGTIITQESSVNDIHGNQLWFHSTIVPVKGEDGEADYLIVVSLDTTERQLAFAKHHQAEKLQAVGQLAGGIAHDFNNQLTVLMNYAHLAKRETIRNPTAMGYIDEILAGILRSADLTRKLLAFARKGQYVIEAVNMHVIITDLVNVSRHSFPKNIEIRTDLDAQPSTVKGDRSQLENALMNIALNSREAMPQGGTLTLSSETVTRPAGNSPDRQFLRIVIADTGIGMDHETRDRIFDPFFTTKKNGTGMGLASVYGTVQGHDGTIEVTSTPGQGTSMTILLPLTAAGNTPDGGPEGETPRSVGRLLLVDDEEMVAKSISLMLKSEGYDVTCRESGEEAIALFEKQWQDFDLVLLDMVMPGMDGEATFRAMREIHPSANILLLSGNCMTGRTEQILRDGAADFVQKPVTANTLCQAIAQALAN